MSIFRFKQFSVTNERSAMKVNTDGVLLGAIVQLRREDRKILDVGTGTGPVALMLAQRKAAMRDDIIGTEKEGWTVEGIDIDEASAAEAAANFTASPWAAHLQALESDFNAFAAKEERFDLIVSNPPYFDQSLQNPEERRSNARHTNSLSYREILEYAGTYLNPGGRVAFVLPKEVEKDLLRYARMCGLGLERITRVRTVPRKPASRIIAEFTPGRIEVPEENLLTIQDGGTSIRPGVHSAMIREAGFRGTVLTLVFLSRPRPHILA